MKHLSPASVLSLFLCRGFTVGSSLVRGPDGSGM